MKTLKAQTVTFSVLLFFILSFLVAYVLRATLTERQSVQ